MSDSVDASLLALLRRTNAVEFLLNAFAIHRVSRPLLRSELIVIAELLVVIPHFRTSVRKTGNKTNDICRVITPHKALEQPSDPVVPLSHVVENVVAETVVDCLFTEEAGKVGVSLGNARPFVIGKEVQGGPHAELGTGPSLKQE